MIARYSFCESVDVGAVPGLNDSLVQDWVTSYLHGKGEDAEGDYSAYVVVTAVDTDTGPAVEMACNLDHVGVVLADRMENSNLAGVAAQSKKRNFFDTAGRSVDMASLLASRRIGMVVARKSEETADSNSLTSEDRMELVVESGIVASNQVKDAPAAHCQTVFD
jgi:hypothetical protein